jgi:hypothetical protein
MYWWPISVKGGQSVVDAYCKVSGKCTGSNVGTIKVDLSFLHFSGLTKNNMGTVELPYHTDAISNADFYENNPNKLFPWEGLANVVYSEHRWLHPGRWAPGSKERDWFSQHWIGDSAGIIRTMVVRANFWSSYSTPNEAALGGGYAPPQQDLQDPSYGEFYGLAFAVIMTDVGVKHFFPYFAHQDLNEIRKYNPSDRNDLYKTETTGFGGPGWKDFHITTYFPYDPPWTYITSR